MLTLGITKPLKQNHLKYRIRNILYMNNIYSIHRNHTHKIVPKDPSNNSGWEYIVFDVILIVISYQHKLATARLKMVPRSDLD